jgi:maltose O-acetyltransferase
MLGPFFRFAGSVKGRLDRARLERRWQQLRALGMHIGNDVNLPASTQIDVSHCFLISIGDHCGFGEECVILAHDAQMDEFLDAARIGRVVIHESCHIGIRSVILAGVEIGPRTIVGAHSVVSKSLPPDTVCAGSPAKVICSLDEYLERHRQAVAAGPRFEYDKYSLQFLTPERRDEMIAAVRQRDAYIVGGRTAELRGAGGTARTAQGGNQ